MKKKLTKIVLGIALSLIVGGFSPSLFAANEIFTGTAIDITGNSATLLFSVENEGVTKAGVAISKTTGFNNPPNVFSCDYLTTYNGKGDYEVYKGGLDNGTIYYYQACGTDESGNNYLGQEKTFTTNSNNECTVESMSFSGNAENWDIDGEVTNIKIVTKNCNSGIRISPKALKGIGSNIETKQIFINGKPNLLIPDSYGEIEIKVKISTAGCYSENGTDPNNGWRYRCVNFLEIYNEAGTLIKTGNDPVLTPSFIRAQDTAEKRVALRKKGVLLGNCGSFCNYGSDNPAEGDEDNWIFQKPIIKGTVGGPDGGSDCILSSGEGIDDPSDVYFDKIEEEDIIGRTARLNIQTSNGCRSKALLIKLFEVDPIKNLTKNLEGNDDDFIYVESPSEGKLILDFQIDEDYCLDSTTPNCEVYVEIYENESLVFSSEKWMDGSEVSPSSNDFKNKVNFKKGVIGHNCGGLDFMCSLVDTDWVFLYTNGKLLDYGGIPPDPLNVNLLDLEEYFDPQSPCYVKPGGELGPSGKTAGDKGGYKEDCYELLAPIPGIGEDGGNGRFSINFSSYELGQYIQSIFNVALGLLMLLSVIMIIVAGVEYMTVESMFGKSRAKGRITGAMTGLILGLGIFIILRTINPQLLEINFGSKVETQKIAYDEPGGDFSNIQTSNAGNSSWPKFDFQGNGIYKPVNCPEGISKVSGFYICGSMAKGLQDMLTAAKADGIILDGGGFRTAEQQLYLRSKNNCPDIQKSPSKDCRPPTAPPGKSNHEFGKAVDLRCKNKLINPEGSGGLGRTPETLPCFNWLKENAGKYGFINWKKENWHWSIDGR